MGTLVVLAVLAVVWVSAARGLIFEPQNNYLQSYGLRWCWRTGFWGRTVSSTANAGVIYSGIAGRVYGDKYKDGTPLTVYDVVIRWGYVYPVGDILSNNKLPNTRRYKLGKQAAGKTIKEAVEEWASALKPDDVCVCGHARDCHGPCNADWRTSCLVGECACSGFVHATYPEGSAGPPALSLQEELVDVIYTCPHCGKVLEGGATRLSWFTVPMDCMFCSSVRKVSQPMVRTVCTVKRVTTMVCHNEPQDDGSNKVIRVTVAEAIRRAKETAEFLCKRDGKPIPQLTHKQWLERYEAVFWAWHEIAEQKKDSV